MRPLAAILAILLGVASAEAAGGVVTVYPPTVFGGVATVVAPDGTLVSTAGTRTSGLQEAIAYMASHGDDLDVIGGNEVSGGAVNYVLSSTLWWPPMQGKRIRIGAVTFSWGTNIGPNPGMVFNSLMMVDFDCTCQIVYLGTGIAVTFKPSSLLPHDQAVLAVQSRVHITTVAMGAGFVAVLFDPTLGAINGCRFEFEEINGSNLALFGVVVASPPAGRSFASNFVTSPSIHGFVNTAMMIGGGPPAGHLRGNAWTVAIDTEVPSAVGIDTYATADLWTIPYLEGPATAPNVLFEATARGNQLRIGWMNPALVTDMSGGKNRIDYQAP